MSKIPVKRGSVKARSSFFEELGGNNGAANGNGASKEKDGGSQQEKVAKPKWMQDLARKTDAHSNVVDKQLKSKLRERKMITDGQTPRKLPPRETKPQTSPELAAMLEKARKRAEAEEG